MKTMTMTSDVLRKTVADVKEPSIAFVPLAEALAAWSKAYDDLEQFETSEPPSEPDLRDWMFLRAEASEELSREAGLRMTID
jgi:hypothetical protein